MTKKARLTCYYCNKLVSEKTSPCGMCIYCTLNMQKKCRMVSPPRLCGIHEGNFITNVMTIYGRTIADFVLNTIPDGTRMCDRCLSRNSELVEKKSWSITERICAEGCEFVCCVCNGSTSDHTRVNIITIVIDEIMYLSVICRAHIHIVRHLVSQIRSTHFYY